jgi:glucosamine 6-phosphate synthetase-like amidotransferase/phosphosugar isomerase protein
MCGIFFYSEKQSLIKKKILNKLIKISEKRGLDNLGICFKNNDID